MPTHAVVSALWRYPVKSMLGQTCESLEFEHRGVKSDRLLAIVDADGKLGSHKSTRRFSRIPGLFDFRAVIEDGKTWIQFPHGRRWALGDAQINGELSTALGRPVGLRKEAAIAHHDDGPVHIITSASLRWLQARLPGSQIDIRRFRPNIVLDIDGNELLEQQWINRTIQIGPVTLQVTTPTERCVMTTLAQQELPSDPAVMRTLASDANGLFGVYATVLKPGQIHLADNAQIHR